MFSCAVKADFYSFVSRDATDPVAHLLPSDTFHFTDCQHKFIFAIFGDPSNTIGTIRDCSEPLPQRRKFMAFKP